MKQLRRRLGLTSGIFLCLSNGVTHQTAAAQAQITGVSVTHPTGSPSVSPVGLVVAYDMSTRTDDGRLRDFGPLGNHGEIQGTSVFPGVFGEATRFHAATDRIHIPENGSLAIDGPITIALRVRVDSLGLHQHLIACDDKFALWVTPQNRIRFSDTLGHGVDSADPIAPGQWHGLVALFDGVRGEGVTMESVRLYLDGQLIDREIVNRTGDDPVRWMPGQLYPSDACYVGFESHQGNEVHQNLPFEGIIDDLLVFDRALSLLEVRALAVRP